MPIADKSQLTSTDCCLVNIQWHLREIYALKRICYGHSNWGFFFLLQRAESLKLCGKICTGNTLMYLYSYQCIRSFLQADQQSWVWDLDAVCHCTFRKPTWGYWEVCYICLLFVWIFTTIVVLNTENQHGNDSLPLESFALCHFSSTMTSSYGSNRNRTWVKASQKLPAPPRAFP